MKVLRPKRSGLRYIWLKRIDESMMKQWDKIKHQFTKHEST